MGATTFTQVGKGKTATEAFLTAVAEARHQYGHGGYTGTLAEKGTFVLIQPPEGADLRAFVADLLNKDDDPRISDKWGPAGCVKLGPEEYVFFGWAST